MNIRYVVLIITTAVSLIQSSIETPQENPALDHYKKKLNLCANGATVIGTITGAFWEGAKVFRPAKTSGNLGFKTILTTIIATGSGGMVGGIITFLRGEKITHHLLEKKQSELILLYEKNKLKKSSSENLKDEGLA